MASSISGTSLANYGQEIYKKYHFTCVYCGFDGRNFDSWLQLSIDHIRPRKDMGSHEEENLVVACRCCNSVTSRMKFAADATRKEILQQKRQKVAERRKVFYEHWIKNVAPLHLNRPLPEIK